MYGFDAGRSVSSWTSSAWLAATRVSDGTLSARSKAAKNQFCIVLKKKQNGGPWSTVLLADSCGLDDAVAQCLFFVLFVIVIPYLGRWMCHRSARHRRAFLSLIHTWEAFVNGRTLVLLTAATGHGPMLQLTLVYRPTPF